MKNIGDMKPGSGGGTGHGADSDIRKGQATTGMCDFPAGGGKTPDMTGSTVGEHTLPQPMKDKGY